MDCPRYSIPGACSQMNDTTVDRTIVWRSSSKWQDKQTKQKHRKLPYKFEMIRNLYRYWPLMSTAITILLPDNTEFCPIKLWSTTCLIAVHRDTTHPASHKSCTYFIVANTICRLRKGTTPPNELLITFARPFVVYEYVHHRQTVCVVATVVASACC